MQSRLWIKPPCRKCPARGGINWMVLKYTVSCHSHKFIRKILNRHLMKLFVDAGLYIRQFHSLKKMVSRMPYILLRNLVSGIYYKGGIKKIFIFASELKNLKDLNSKFIFDDMYAVICEIDFIQHRGL